MKLRSKMFLFAILLIVVVAALPVPIWAAPPVAEQSYTEILSRLVVQFFRDVRVRAIFALITMDVLMAVACAFAGVGEAFNLKKVGTFYKTMVVPFVIGYLAFYIGMKLIPDVSVLGEYSYLIGEVPLAAWWLAILASLGTSIAGHVKDLGVVLVNKLR